MMKKRYGYYVLTLFFLSILSTPVVVHGQQEQTPSQSQKTPPAKQIETPQMDDQSMKLFLDKIEVEGKLEKPQAVFIIPGTNPMIDDFQIERSFFDEIFRPVERKGHTIIRPAAKPKTDRKDVIPW